MKSVFAVLFALYALTQTAFASDLSTIAQLSMLTQHMTCSLTGLENSPYLEITAKDEILINDPFALITLLATPLNGEAVNASMDLINDSSLQSSNIDYVREILIEDSKLQKPLHAIIKVKDCVNPNDENHITALTIVVPSIGDQERCCYVK